MNVGEAKKLTLKLLDETKPKADLTGRLNAFFDAGQRAVAMIKPVVKTLPITVINGVYELPPAVIRVRGLRRLQEPDRRTTFTSEGNRLYLADGDYHMEYDADPAAIPDNAPDSTPFEVDADCHLALCYYAAAQCQSMEYDRRFYEAFIAQWQEMLINLTQATTRPVAAVESGGGWI